MKIDKIKSKICFNCQCLMKQFYFYYVCKNCNIEYEYEHTNGKINEILYNSGQYQIFLLIKGEKIGVIDYVNKSIGCVYFQLDISGIDISLKLFDLYLGKYLKMKILL